MFARDKPNVFDVRFSRFLRFRRSQVRNLTFLMFDSHASYVFDVHTWRTQRFWRSHVTNLTFLTFTPCEPNVFDIQFLRFLRFWRSHLANLTFLTFARDKPNFLWRSIVTLSTFLTVTRGEHTISDVHLWRDWRSSFGVFMFPTFSSHAFWRFRCLNVMIPTILMCYFHAYDVSDNQTWRSSRFYVLLH